MINESIQTMRREFGEHDARRDAGLSTPAEIERFDDLSYGPHGVWNRLDVYRRRDAVGQQPVLVNVHGGGYVYGTKETYQFYAMGMALRGFTVVNFNYRLAPEHRYPCALEDTNAVMAWICAHREDYGLDTDQVFMVGDSAGAALLSEYATLCSSESFRQLFGWTVPAFCLRAIALNCGFYCVSDRFVPEGEALRAYYGDEPMAQHGDRLRLHRYIDRHYPPTCLMTCEGDFLKEGALPMAQVLQAANVEYRLDYYRSEKKALYHVFHINQRSDDARRCNDAQAAFFRQFIV